MNAKGAFDIIKPDPDIMRKGTRWLFLFASFFLLAGLWVATSRLAAGRLCREVIQLSVLRSAPDESCRPSSWLWPRVELTNVRSSSPVPFDSFELHWTIQQATMQLDPMASWRGKTPVFRLLLRQPTLLVHSLASATDEDDTTLRSLVPLATSLVPVLWSPALPPFRIEHGTLQLQSASPTESVVPLARDLRLSLERTNASSLRVELQGRLGSQGAPLRATVSLAAHDGDVQIDVAGQWKALDGVLIEVERSRALVETARISVPEVSLRLNGAPVVLAGTVSREGEEPGRLQLRWQSLHIAPLVDALWADMRGSLQGTLGGEFTLGIPPPNAFADPAHWTLEGQLAARRLRWSGVNVLYGLLGVAYNGLTGQGDHDLPRTLREQFPNELLPAQTTVDRARALVRFAGQQLHLNSVGLQAPHYQLEGNATVGVVDGRPTIEATFTLTTAKHLSAALCQSVKEYCNLVTESGEAVFRYRWRGDPRDSLPQWVPENVPRTLPPAAAPTNDLPF